MDRMSPSKKEKFTKRVEMILLPDVSENQLSYDLVLNYKMKISVAKQIQ